MLWRATGAPRSLTLLCAIALSLTVPARVSAQSAGSEGGTARAAMTGESDTQATPINLLVGRSTVINTGLPIARVSLTRPEIADALVTASQQLLVHGKAPGTISMFIWDRSGAIKRYDVTVARDLSLLAEQLRALFPGETISVTGNGKDVVVAGTVSSKYVIEKAGDVAAGYVDKKEDVVNLLRQQEGVATDQVLLRVRFAEISRTALTELGLNMFSDGQHNVLGSSTTQQFPAPFFDQKAPDVGKTLVFSDYLNLFLFDMKNQLGITIRALQNRGLLQTLAEPNLIAQNGKEASFLAGGEYPYPVVQGAAANLSITIVFKEYGIRLNFTPTLIGGDLVHLKVRPEVSTLDFANAISYQGFKIPALSTRRADTEIELMDGQTFAIAGLLNNTVTSTLSKVPGIGDIPILGLLFRSKSAQKGQTELVVMITPQILRRGAMGAAAGMPNFPQPFLGPEKKTVPPPAPRLPGSVQKQDDSAPAPVPAPQQPAAPPASASPAPAARPGAAPATNPSAPAPAAAAVAERATAPASGPPAAPRQLPAAVVVTPSAPARVTVPASPQPAPAAAEAAPAPAAPKIDPKKLAAERQAAEKAAQQKAEQDRQAAALKADEDRKAADKAARELRLRQEEEGRALARQRELDEQRRIADAKAADEKRKADAKAAEEQHRAELKRAEEQVKAERERLALAQKQADEARKQDDKAAKERAKRDAEVAKQVADAQKKQVDAEKKRLKEINDAVERLNAAQAAYQAAVEKVKKDGAQQHQ